VVEDPGTSRNNMHENRETSKASIETVDQSAKAPSRNADKHAMEESDCCVVCAEQRVDREGSSPSGAQMRSAVSKSGGNSSLAGKSGRYGETYTGTKAKAGNRPRRTWSRRSAVPGGQGVHGEVESEGHEEKYRAVIDGGHPEDEPVGQRWGKVEPAL
jgi:hypothetical protein